jgi:hypothetical protein
MESGLLHVVAALIPEKVSPVPHEYVVGWTPQAA